MKNICVVITARPSYSRIKTALAEIKQHPKLELQLIVAGSALLNRFGNAVSFIESDGFEINEKVYMMLEGDGLATMAKTTGLGIMELSTAFLNLKPDVVLTIADRYETMATAIAASYMNIPLVHIQGGEVTGNIDEKVRHAITKLADVHLVASEDAKKRVIKLGENPEMVINTGCPSIDLAKGVLENPKLDFQPTLKYGGVGAEMALEGNYLVVLQHPVTTSFDQALQQINETLKAVYELNIPTYWFWPNPDAGSDGTSKALRVFREQEKDLKIHFFKNMEGKDFLKLLYNSKCLIGNSSAGIRECSFLGVPVVNIGDRQNKRIRGENVVDVDYDYQEIKSAITNQIEHGRYATENQYGNGASGIKIAEVLANLDSISISKTITY